MRTLIFSLVAVTLALPMAAGISEPVQTEGGQLSGVAGASPEVRVYKGIPYAAPPVGDLRWRVPQPARWEGVLKADHFSSTCMQSPYPEGSPYRGTDADHISEDCLYLNIWTGANNASERRPVMVWIHGGALTRGSGSTPTYDGENFAEKGVVLVTINYRLGVFGYFAHPELSKESGRNASGNYGFLDQVAALQWVQRNIEKFGGDPRRVTVFGESAGSWSVNFLVASPIARGLFQRAIGESGANLARVQSLADAEQAGVKFAGSMGAQSIAELRAKPAGELLRAQRAPSGNIDGYFLPTDVSTIFSTGRQNDVPTVIGFNADEGTAFTPDTVRAEGFEAQVKSRYGDQADAFLAIYPANTDKQARASAAAVFRDQTFGWEMRTWARMQSKTGKSKVYLYYFSKVPPGPFGARLGVYHASEIAYVFGNLGETSLSQEDHRKLSGIMQSYWVNFANFGDPNGHGLPRWPNYQEKADVAIELGDNVETTTVPGKAGLDFIDARFLQDSPFLGTWKLNAAKSTPASLAGMTTYEIQGRVMKVSMEMIAADGSRQGDSYVSNYDGRDSLIFWTGTRGPETVALKRLNANTSEAIWKKGGKVIQTSQSTVSPDGKVLTITQTATKAKGEPATSLLVFDKQ
jgi:para-nitrobenzyl esterase